MSALQTLRFISSRMSDTQNQVSTGLRVAQASDNAAYWSIATTMRSDNKALAAVGDVLGLAAAKVDVAYSGMESVVSVISEIKAKIVAASESGVDRQKVQFEIDQLKDQLSGIASSASFNRVNWLATDVADASDNKTSIVASLSRDGSGNIGINNIAVDLREIALFNTAGDGLLQKTGATGPADYGGLATITTPVDTVVFSGSFTLKDGDVLQFDLMDGADTFTVTVSNAILRSSFPSWDGNVDDRSKLATLVMHSSHVAGRGLFAISGSSGSQFFGDDYPNPASLSNFRVVSTAPSLTIMDVDVTKEDDLGELLSQVDAWLEDTINAAANLGALSARISTQGTFVDRLTDSIDRGVGQLVDADMNEASTRLRALQTQEQLAIQSLSISNSNSESILFLFG